MKINNQCQRKRMRIREKLVHRTRHNQVHIHLLEQGDQVAWMEAKKLVWMGQLHHPLLAAKVNHVDQHQPNDCIITVNRIEVQQLLNNTCT